MERKRIAVIIAQLDENTQTKFMEGFLKEAFARDYDVCVFSMFLKFQATPLREVGDSNIYNLIQVNLFDAIVIMLDTLQTPGVADAVQEKIKRDFDGPVLVVDKESPYFPNVMIDHYTPIVKLVDHLIEVHGYTDIAFLNGRKGHIHSVERLQGYKDSMKAHGLPVSEDKIFQGTYWYDSGNSMVEKMMEDREHLPQAIACANDAMAVGVCAAFNKYGIRVPEDIAVTGYDSMEDGRRSPVPITSAEIPAEACGAYSAKWIDAVLHNEELPEFKTEVPLFIGGSCGCPICQEKNINVRRMVWETDLSTDSYYSCFNHIMEDLLAQTDYKGFYNTVFQYAYQIRQFDSFHLCLNDYWKIPEHMIGDEALRRGYTGQVYQIIKCGSDENIGNTISLDNRFPSSKLLPELYEQRKKPTVFIFSPVFFDDRSFGYAVVSYGNEPKVYNDIYRVWMTSIMQGMEIFYRQAGLRNLLAQTEANQIRDALTGLYNYRGFLKQAEEFIEEAVSNDKSIMLTAIDMCGLKTINTNYGRKAGDRAIMDIAQIVSESLLPGELCCRMYSDEFLIASAVTAGDGSREAKLWESITKKIDALNASGQNTFVIRICNGIKTDRITRAAVLENLVNETLNIKNKNKAKQNLIERKNEGLNEKDKEQDLLVQEILDDNKLTYFFQPIVDARTGQIYSYEALMRADVEKKISPVEILASAERQNRLSDVERATFFNVLNYMDAHRNQFVGKKVFINSIPGYQLEGQDREMFKERVSSWKGNMVVEFTEETEMDDIQLAELKENYRKLGIDTAIDDYGSGYSNVNNLLRYMPHYVKIDRMLLTDIYKEPQKQHFVRDIIEFAHDNDIIALAEGVETAKELKEVIRLGADLIQGYYTAKPKQEIIESIDEKVVNEIVQYNQSTVSRNGKKIYTVEKTERVTLVQLVLNKYTEVFIPAESSGNIEILGAAGFQSNIMIRIEDGFHGTVALQNVSLAGERGYPCIECGKNVNIVLKLEADNEMRTGGICVPESSTLTVQGDGNLSISIDCGRYYGIGNALDKKHGTLIFDQDGAIMIDARGMKGIGIGSGLGGEIQINRGRYDIDMSGQEGVAIGSFLGAVNMRIEYCDMAINAGYAQGTIIGSCEQDADIYIENVSISLISLGSALCGIGTLHGKNCRVEIKNACVIVGLRALECYAIGSQCANTDIRIRYATVKLSVQGREAISMGNKSRNAKIYVGDSDLNSKVVNNLDIDVGADDVDIIIENGQSEFLLNDAERPRKVIAAEF